MSPQGHDVAPTPLAARLPRRPDVTADLRPAILFLVNSLHEGGTERQAVQLAQEVQTLGRFRVHLATLDARGELSALVAASRFGDVPEFRLRSFYDRQMVRQLERCAAFMRGHGVALVHTHGFYPNIFGLLAATIAGVPVRIASKRETIGCRTAWQTRAERLAFRLAHVIVANCDAVGEQLASSGVPARRITTIHSGVLLSRVQPEACGRHEALKMLGLPCSPELSYVTLVANFHLLVKDHTTFLRAAQRVRASVPHVRFVIAGVGVRLAEMRSRAAHLGLEGDVIFLGHCERIAELLFVSDVGVLSSLGEGLPNAVLEYMAAGRPVVATDAGGTRELVVDHRTGFLVAPHDDGAMAARIVTLLRDPARAREMGREGRRLVFERFSRAHQLDRIVALYESELRRASRSRWRSLRCRSSLSYSPSHSSRIADHS